MEIYSPCILAKMVNTRVIMIDSKSCIWSEKMWRITYAHHDWEIERLEVTGMKPTAQRMTIKEGQCQRHWDNDQENQLQNGIWSELTSSV